MSQSTVTTVISFGGSSDSGSGAISAEIDGTMHLDAEGSERSQFLLDEEVYFLLHYDPAKVRVIRLRATDDGDVHRIGSVVRKREEQITFLHPADLHSLSYQPEGGLLTKWYGRSSNVYLQDGQYHADLAPCLGDIEYSVRFEQYLHKPAPVQIPDGEEFPTDIIIEYEEISG